MPQRPGSTVDWSMGSRADRLLDPTTASIAARSVAGRGPSTTPDERARLRTDLATAVDEASPLVVAATGLVVDGPAARASILSRGAWVDTNLRGLQRILDPLAARIVPEGSSWPAFRRRAIGGQLGLLLGYASRKVLGQYDPFLPPDDDGLLTFIGPNVIEAERLTGVPARDFRFWIALHEVTHRVQFGSTPWLRGHLASLAEAYVGAVADEPDRVGRRLRSIAERVREETAVGPGLMLQLMTGPQRDLFRRMQGLMSLLEGHATYVMNVVARPRVADLDGMRRALRRRRRVAGAERAFQRATGFEMKVRQYDAGERFVRTVVDRIGMDGFNAVWSAARMLPDAREIAEPQRWLARVRKD